MAFKEIVAPSVRGLFVTQLVGMILSGELRPGERLPTGRELAEKMRISRGKGTRASTMLWGDFQEHLE